MKSLWNSFKIAFAMFSKIPMPQADWSEENMRYMLCFFPFVGAAVGVVMLGMEWLCRYFGMSNGFIAGGTGTGTGNCNRRNSCRWPSGHI